MCENGSLDLLGFRLRPNIYWVTLYKSKKLVVALVHIFGGQDQENPSGVGGLNLYRIGVQ